MIFFLLWTLLWVLFIRLFSTEMGFLPIAVAPGAHGCVIMTCRGKEREAPGLGSWGWGTG